MTYDVLLENEQERSYTATLLGWPKLTASAPTREKALGELQRTVEERLSRAEIVKMEVDLPQAPNPWRRLAGIYNDDPLFEDFLAEMEADRRELDAEEAGDTPATR